MIEVIKTSIQYLIDREVNPNMTASHVSVNKSEILILDVPDKNLTFE